jgi:hypothetical protein
MITGGSAQVEPRSQAGVLVAVTAAAPGDNVSVPSVNCVDVSCTSQPSPVPVASVISKVSKVLLVVVNPMSCI